jgi:hypothetical protein
MVIPRVLVGVGLLAFGRKAFWLFVGGVGFVLGLNLATRVVHAPQGWIVLTFGLVVGLLGALVALVLQHVAVGLAGFVAGGYVAWNVAGVLGWQRGGSVFGAWEPWLVFLIGGILFAVLIGTLFEWSLIVLSSITGATLVTQTFTIPTRALIPLFAVLVATGVVIQAAMYRAEQKGGPPPRKKQLDTARR